ncbi:MAG: hypothetical protein WBA57_16130 [Elainellaceae cyanobacterium]
MNTLRLFSRLLLVPIILGASSCSPEATADSSSENPTPEIISPTSIDVNPPDATCSVLESADYSDIHGQHKQFAIPEGMFNQLMDEAFYAQYPDLNGRSLTYDDGDAEWRSRWLEIAKKLLNSLERLSPNTQQKLGQYNVDNYQYWRQKLAVSSISEKAFTYLADARFKALFPQYADKELNPQGAGQIWYAIADEAFQSMNSGDNLEMIQLAMADADGGSSYSSQSPTSNSTTICEYGRCEIESSHLLKAAGTIAYIIPLKQGMTLTLSKKIPSFVNLTVLSPDGETLLPRSSVTHWSQEISKSGFYEILVTSECVDEIKHSLALEVVK